MPDADQLRRAAAAQLVELIDAATPVDAGFTHMEDAQHLVDTIAAYAIAILLQKLSTTKES